MVRDVVQFDQLAEPSARGISGWSSKLSRTLRSWVERAELRAKSHCAFNQFAEAVREAQDATEVEAVLMRQTLEWTGAELVELIQHETTKRVACRPSVRRSGEDLERAEVRVPLRLGGQIVGALRLVAQPGQRWSNRTIEQLKTLGTLAAGAMLACRAEHVQNLVAEVVTEGDAVGRTFLMPFLDHSIKLARRRREPLSVLCVGIDRFRAIEELLGWATADQGARHMARIIARALRASDLVARLDAGRFLVILADAPNNAAPMIAETVSSAVFHASKPTKTLPVLTISIGVATFPDHAESADALLLTAAEALDQARQRGHHQIEVAHSPQKPSQMWKLAKISAS